MAKLYAITSGEYSDYGIITLCSDRRKAEKLVEWYNRYEKYDKAEIEEYEDGEIVPDETLIPYEVSFDERGNVSRVVQGDPMSAIRADVIPGRWGGFYAHVLATDEEGAKKTAAEKRAKWLAEHTGNV